MQQLGDQDDVARDEEGTDRGKKVAAAKPGRSAACHLPKADHGKEDPPDAPAGDPLAPEQKAEQRDDQHEEVVEDPGAGDRRPGDAEDEADVGGGEREAYLGPLGDDVAVESPEPAQAEGGHDRRCQGEAEKQEGERRNLAERDLVEYEAPSPEEGGEDEEAGSFGG